MTEAERRLGMYLGADDYLLSLYSGGLEGDRKVCVTRQSNRRGECRRFTVTLKTAQALGVTK